MDIPTVFLKEAYYYHLFYYFILCLVFEVPSPIEDLVRRKQRRPLAS